MKQKLVSLAMLPLALVSTLSFASLHQPMYTAESVVVQESVSAVPVSFEQTQSIREGISKYHSRLSAGNNKVVAHSEYGLTVFDLTDGALTYLLASDFPEGLNNWSYNMKVGTSDNHIFYYQNSYYRSYSIESDGALTPKQNQTNLSSQIRFTLDGKTAYTNSYTYSSNSYAFNLYSQNDNTGTLDFVAQYNSTENIRPISYDAANQVFVFSRTDTVTQNLLISTAVLNNGSWTAIADMPLSAPYYYNIESAAYNSSTGHLAINVWGTTHLIQVTASGQMSQLQQADNYTIFGTYNPQIFFAGNTLISASQETLLGFDVSSSGLINKRTLPHISSKTTTTDSGQLVTLNNRNGLSLFSVASDALHVEKTLAFSDYEFSWPSINDYTTVNKIELAGGYVATVDAYNALLLLRADEDGTVKQQQSIPDNTYQSKTLFKVSETALLVLTYEHYFLYQLNSETQMLEETASNSVASLFANNQTFYSGERFAFADGMLYIFYNDRVSAFNVTDTTVTFADTAADNVAGFIGLSNTVAAVEHDKKLYAVSRSTNALYSLTIQNNKIIQTVIDESFNADYSVQMFSNGGQLHIWYRNIIAVYAEQESGSMQLLANNPQPTNSTQYIWDGFMLERLYNQAIIYQFDQTTGFSQPVETITADSNNSLSPVISIGDYVYLSSTFTPKTVLGYRVNRAPRQTASIGKLTLHAGVATTVALANNFVDDDNDTITFTKISGSDALTVSEAGVLAYNGNSATDGETVINVIDSRGLVTTLTVMFDVNAAPALTAEWATPVINQQQYFLINLNDYFADPEDSVITFSGVIPATMQLTANGLLTGTPMQSGSETLQITVTDPSGAFQTIALTMMINAKPVISGELTYRITTGDSITVDLAQLFTDTDSQDLTFTIDGLPNGISLTDNQLVGTANEGKYNVLVTATDSFGAATTAELQITVDGKSGGSFGLSALLLLMLAMFRQRRFQ